MDWSFTEEQEQIAALTRQILERELTEERRRAIDASDNRFDEPLYRTLSQAGVLDPSLGLIELCRVLIEIGRFVAPLPAATLVIAAKTLGETETGLPTLALTEDLNPDLMAPVTRAVMDGGEVVISGTKSTVPLASVAEVFAVSAAIDDRTPALYTVRRDVPGVAVQAQLVTNTDREGIVELSEVRLSAEAKVGGADALKSVIDHLTVALCAVQLGICERALELTAEYAKQRVQFDRPIATFQAVGQRLADGFIDVEAMRLTLWQAVWRLSEGLPSDTEIATAKFWASDAGHRLAHTAVHIHGGVGIDLDYPLHRYFVAAKRIEFMLGNAPEQLRTIGRTLATEPV